MNYVFEFILLAGMLFVGAMLIAGLIWLGTRD